MRHYLIVPMALFASLAVAGPLQGQAATSVCKDGSTSTATGRGACSGHGGVDAKATKAAHSAATAKKSAAAQVTCADGTTSKPGRGACSRHGGVQGAVASSAAKTAPAPATKTAPAPVTKAASAPSAPARSASSNATTKKSTRGEDNDPTGAIAKCKDGMYSHAAQRRGACSRHGGVAQWLSQ